MECPWLTDTERLRRQEARNTALVEYLRREHITEMVVDSRLFAQAWASLPHLRLTYGCMQGLKIPDTLVLNAAQLPADDPLSSTHVQSEPKEELLHAET